MAEETPKTWGLVSASDLLWKLERELERCREAASANDREDLVDAGINIAITAWHMIDWTWNSLKRMDQAHASKVTAALGAPIDKGKRHFTSWAFQRCPELKYCRDIATWSKHLEIGRFGPSSPELQTEVSAAPTTVVSGSPQLVEPSGIPWTLKIVDGDRRLKALDVFEHNVLEFWTGVIYGHNVDWAPEPD